MKNEFIIASLGDRDNRKGTVRLKEIVDMLGLAELQPQFFTLRSDLENTMARIFIDLPEQFSFSTEIPLYYMHINMGGHLDNSMLLSIISEAKIRFYRAIGWRDSAEGLGTVVGDVAVQYISEAFYGEVMVVDMTAREFNKHGFDVVFRVSDKASGREVGRGKTGVVFYDRQANKVALVPESFRSKFPR